MNTSTTSMPTEDATTADEAPIPAFSELGLSDDVLQAVADLGYETPSPVQAQAIPYVLEGKDVLAAAQTGTGKTAAFLLPTMSRLPHAARNHGPEMLVVTPTRELAQQIETVCKTVARRTGHKSVTVVGGVGYEPQKAALRRGCDVLVATPGRLIDLINQDVAHLGEVRVLVLDEADRMLDMGFLPDMRRIVAQTSQDRQTLLFSATLDEKAIGGIRDLVSDPAIVEIAHKGTVADTIDQYALPVSLETKNDLLAQVLLAEGPQHAIVFCRTKHRADSCCRRLRRAGISCAPIHGDRSQAQRQRALKGFRDGRVDVLVATDVLARGIDVSDVRYVINFDVPEDPEDYIHRIGRTGRAGETGWALTFVTVNDFEELRDCEFLMGQIVPEYPRAGEFELGEQPPALDPDRSTEREARGNGGAGTRKRKRGRRKKKATAEDVALESAARGVAEQAGEPKRSSRGESKRTPRRGGRGQARQEQDGGAKAAPKGAKAPARPKASSRPSVSEEEFELLSEREVRAINRSAGRRGSGQQPRRAQGANASRQGGRGTGEGRPRNDGRGRKRGQGSHNRYVESQTPATPRPSSKRGRRPGDRQGRSRGIY